MPTADHLIEFDTQSRGYSFTEHLRHVPVYRECETRRCALYAHDPTGCLECSCHDPFDCPHTSGTRAWMTCAGGDHHQQPACCCDDRDGWYRVAHGENHMWIPGLGWGIDQGCACHVIEQFLDDELWDAILASPTVQAHAIGNRIRVPVRIKYGDYDTWRILPAWKETR